MSKLENWEWDLLAAMKYHEDCHPSVRDPDTPGECWAVVMEAVPKGVLATLETLQEHGLHIVEPAAPKAREAESGAAVVDMQGITTVIDPNERFGTNRGVVHE